MLQQRRRTIGFRLIALLILSALTSACAAGKKGSNFRSLVGEGLIGISSNSPSVGANLYIAEQLQRSKNLFSFVQSAGSPNAIELRGNGSREPELHMYYWPDEVYIADYSKQGERKSEWIIRGPIGITRSEFLTLRDLRTRQGGSGIFEVFGSDMRFAFASSGEKTTMAMRDVEPDIPFIPKPTPKPKIKKKPKDPKKMKGDEGGENGVGDIGPMPIVPKVPKLDPRNWLKLNTDQRAILLSQGYAERADNGDIVHIIHRSGITLANLAKWYTGNPDNVTNLAELNEMPIGARLKKGIRVIVPIGLVTEYKKMP